MPWGLGIWVVSAICSALLVSVTVGDNWFRACPRPACRAGDGRFHGPAGGSSGLRLGVPAGQAGLLARVMTACAVRVAVSARLACSKVLGHFALRARCRFRSMTVRSLASALVRVV